MAKKKPKLPVAPLPDLMGWWRAHPTRGVLIGGLAVSLLAKPRVTRDIDVLVLLPPKQWQSFLKAGVHFGFVARHQDTIEFAREARVLLLRHTPTGIDLDVSLGNLPFEEEAVDRAVFAGVAGVAVPLPTPEDLIIMKAVAHRDQDLLDIDCLLAAHPSLDLERVRRWVLAFATALESSEICDDLEKRLLRPTVKKRGKRKPE